MDANTPELGFILWLQQARAVFALIHGEEAARRPLRVTIRDDAGHIVSLAIPEQDPASKLRPMERRILDALLAAGKPMSTKALAAALGCKVNTVLYEALRNLQQPGRTLIRRTSKGFVPEGV
jgi:hypothetical protein